ncbi:MAG: DNA replication complex GINS family protein [Candidatus Aenigmarchaeota archaeon]|nr:DNA replication complex GINS family protein [Candidatus Aenigmarchaeota archaeon]
MLTFETIRKIFEEERSNKGLSSLPDDFFSEAKEYLEKKMKLVRSETEKWEVDSVRIRLRTIFEKRERKIMEAALNYVHSGHEIGNMIPEERKFFDDVVERIRNFQKERLKRFEDDGEGKTLVSILGDVEKFVGMNMKNYGPFKKGDITTLPEANANLLIEKGLAEKMNVNE